MVRGIFWRGEAHFGGTLLMIKLMIGGATGSSQFPSPQPPPPQRASCADAQCDNRSAIPFLSGWPVLFPHFSPSPPRSHHSHCSQPASVCYLECASITSAHQVPTVEEEPQRARGRHLFPELTPTNLFVLFTGQTMPRDCQTIGL